jgi:hypothetical protein
LQLGRYLPCWALVLVGTLSSCIRSSNNVYQCMWSLDIHFRCTFLSNGNRVLQCLNPLFTQCWELQKNKEFTFSWKKLGKEGAELVWPIYVVVLKRSCLVGIFFNIMCWVCIGQSSKYLTHGKSLSFPKFLLEEK